MVVVAPGTGENGLSGKVHDACQADDPDVEPFGFVEVAHMKVDVADVGFGRRTRPWGRSVHEGIEAGGVQFSVSEADHNRWVGPFRSGPVPVEFDAVPLRIVEVDCLREAVIDESGEWRLGFGEMGKSPREVAPFGDA